MRRLVTLCLLTIALIIGLLPAGALASADYSQNGGNQYWYDDFTGEAVDATPSEWERVYNVPSGSFVNPAKLRIAHKDELWGEDTCIDTGTGCKWLHWRFPSGEGAQAIRFIPNHGNIDLDDFENYEAIARVYRGSATTALMTQGSGGSDWAASQLAATNGGTGFGGWTNENNSLYHYSGANQSVGSGNYLWYRLARVAGGMEACWAADTTHVTSPPVPSHASWQCDYEKTQGGDGDFGMRLGYGVDRWIDVWSVATGEDCEDGDCAFWHDNENVTP